MKRAFADYLRDILDAMEKAQRFIANMIYENFIHNPLYDYQSLLP